ncbi:uncharacterized protein LOC129939602 [Eupeodes corollae]|uniref:uncharacterized protein LOC129939602 n=1 Tax=Eupeodes corollae TaxID=290404 RepID=UPI00248F9377|nr:uncharacterized protein LOC129939602 [Eupeodes corollae]XP_055903652.1 uncharacterized protein LOC129939602 [Eupeodes corollae]
MIYMEEELIKLVRESTILWDLKHRDYRNQTSRKEAWDAIGEKLGKSGEYSKETWNKLRNAYTNALNRRKSRLRQESSRKMPKWTFEDQMAFLPYTNVGRPRQFERLSIEASEDDTQDQEQQYDNSNDDNIEVNAPKHVDEQEQDIKPSLFQIGNEALSTDQSDINARHFENSSFQEFATPPTTTRRESKLQNSKLISTMNELVRTMKNQNRMMMSHNISRKSYGSGNSNIVNNCSSSSSHDEDEMYFLSLARFVKKLKPAERIRVKGEVSQIIFQAELRSLPKDEQN